MKLDWIDVGLVADIPPMGARVVRSAGGDIAVFRTADDQVFALYDRCPHKGGPLSEGIVHGRIRHLPVAQLGDQPRERRGRGSRPGLRGADLGQRGCRLASASRCRGAARAAHG